MRIDNLEHNGIRMHYYNKTYAMLVRNRSAEGSLKEARCTIILHSAMRHAYQSYELLCFEVLRMNFK